MVEIDTAVPLERVLLRELVEALSLEGEADDYELRSEGSLEQPVLVLVAKTRTRIRGIREISPQND